MRRVLVLGPAASRGSLAAVRSLGRAGWTVGVASPQRGSLVARSRHVHTWHPCPPPSQPEDFERALTQILQDSGYAVVLASGDDWLVGLLRLRDRLPAVVPYAPTSSVLQVLDKLTLHRLAGAAGLLVPPTVVADDTSVLAWEGPAVVKPRHHGLIPLDGRRLEAAVLAGSDIEPQVRRVHAHGTAALLQPPLRGPLVALVVLTDRDARPVALAQQESLGVWPPRAGVSTRARLTPVDPAIAGPALAMLADLEWYGLAQLQFVATPQGPVLLDLNPRWYGSMALAVAGGLDLPDLWCRLALGLDPGPSLPPAVGTRYAWMEGDLRRAVVERRGGLLHDVLDTVGWARSAHLSVVDARDPVPALTYGAELVRRATRRSLVASRRPGRSRT
jgi:predicted ATP-grasp superfamily ATP-dependent carboligase